jgi:cytochrome c553
MTPMMTKTTTVCLAFSLVFLSTVFAAAKGASATAPARPDADAARGKYLVRAMLCNDCHTPFKLGPNGPEPDMTRMLSGHPADLKMPPAPALPPGPWAMVGAATNTAWAGPWGVSFTANLTPDADTGLGGWTPEMFIQALRTGKHQGKGRPILPPMPYQWISQLTDADLRAVFAYLQSIPAISNKVPAPIDAEPEK